MWYIPRVWGNPLLWCARRPSFGAAMERVKESIRPVEFSGEAGDAIFFHHRVLHSGGVNVVGAAGPRIRLAVPSDWQKVFDPAAVAASRHAAPAWTQVKVCRARPTGVQRLAVRTLEIMAETTILKSSETTTNVVWAID